MIGDILIHAMFGWTALIPWWAYWLAGIAAVGLAYRLCGWPGIVALAAAAGYVFGRSGVTKLPDAVLPPAVAPKPAPPKKRMKSLEDLIRGK